MSNLSYTLEKTLQIPLEGGTVTVQPITLHGGEEGHPYNFAWPSGAMIFKVNSREGIEKFLEFDGYGRWGCFNSDSARLLLLTQEQLPEAHPRRCLLVPFDVERYSIESDFMVHEVRGEVVSIPQRKAPRPVVSTAQAVGGAVLEGGKMAAAHKLNETIAKAARKLAIRLGIAPEVAERETFGRVVEFLGPFVLHYASEQFDIPGRAVIQAATKKAMEANAFQVVTLVLTSVMPELATIREEAERLASHELPASPEKDVVEETANFASKTHEKIPEILQSQV